MLFLSVPDGKKNKNSLVYNCLPTKKNREKDRTINKCHSDTQKRIRKNSELWYGRKKKNWGRKFGSCDVCKLKNDGRIRNQRTRIRKLVKMKQLMVKRISFFFGKGGKVHTHSLFPLKMMNMERQGICCIRDAFEIPECKNQRMHRRQWDEEKTKSEMEIKSKNKKGKAVNRYKTR